MNLKCVHCGSIWCIVSSQICQTFHYMSWDPKFGANYLPNTYIMDHVNFIGLLFHSSSYLNVCTPFIWVMWLYLLFYKQSRTFSYVWLVWNLVSLLKHMWEHLPFFHRYHVNLMVVKTSVKLYLRYASFHLSLKHYMWDTCLVFNAL